MKSWLRHLDSPDRCGQWGSGICLAHCLLWPTLALWIPAWLLAGFEPILWAVLVGFVLWSCWRTPPWKSKAWIGFALGLGLMGIAHAVLPASHWAHLPCALIASCLLAFAHHRQLRSHREHLCCAANPAGSATAPVAPCTPNHATPPHQH